MIKILTRIPHPGDGVSLYRGFGPLGHLRTIMDIDFIQCNDFNWPTLAQADGVYMVRPATDSDVAVMTMAQKCKKPVWIDYDDHVLKIPPSNPGYSFYAKPKIQENVKHLLKQADVVSVSTEFLRLELSQYRDKEIHYIPNAFPSNLLEWEGLDAPRKKIISWRGSRTHDKDLSFAHEFFIEAQKQLPDWMFFFFGEIDYKTMDLFEPARLRIYPYSDVIDYFHLLKSIGSSIHIVPLEENDFNRSKSNIAWIEATWAGAAVFSANLPEFKVPGVSTIDKIFLEPHQLSERLTLSRKYIESHLMLDQVNLLRKKILLESFR